MIPLVKNAWTNGPSRGKVLNPTFLNFQNGLRFNLEINHRSPKTGFSRKQFMMEGKNNLWTSGRLSGPLERKRLGFWCGSGSLGKSKDQYIIP